ncbi:MULTISPECIES: cytochrome P450 [unclassified Mesorhizobium]|uniref:cytochrome P450 n=1 Tax=unclassified Mesorhizobium TaxID=325217 RepID=UPI001CCB9766|nr:MULTISPECIES: cytochrome P450 [unclassified Mesorhizobium]MBZ9743549.1 cytochrome P450 [Mesorhizobium sp. CO1-1-4]MBZ9804829.1 cytochrome P450 [Mesorhizobium sp. ES1-6]
MHTGPSEAVEHPWQGVRAGAFEGAADTYAIHDEMRRQAPVWQAPWGDVYVTGYDLVSNSLADRKLSHVPPGSEAAQPDSAIRDWLIYQEGSAHAALRQALQQPFVGKGMAALRPVVAQAVDEFVGDAGLSDAVDVVAAFTRAVPERIIGRLLGVPDEDMPLIRAWSVAIRTMLDTGFDDAFGDGANPADEMSGYFVEHLRHLLAAADLPPLLAGLPALADALGLTAAGRNIAFLAFAGHETTVHLIGNMLFHLAHRPDQWTALRADRRLAANAVAETLRLESPVQKICRWPLEPVVLGGREIGKDRLVVLLVGAANRDPAQFADASRFDLGRAGRQNLAFGRGAHVCIGRALAEIEGHAVLEAALARWKTIEPVGWQWMDNSSIRGLDALTLRLTA